ncbi:MAG: hypothetical protein RI907_575 [Pseudomonadota bacterium]|jgi:hypothetical protein
MPSHATLDLLRQGRLSGARRLDLACGLTEVPPEVLGLADTLEVLNLTGNALSQLPDWLPQLRRLQVIFCSDNAFTELPAVLGRCEALTMVGFKHNRIAHVPAQSLPPRLRWLILTDNALTALPDELGSCTALQKLMLAGNRLTQLPDSLRHCEALELLRVSDNQLAALPEVLLTLPRLAWLAHAGNPCSATREAQAAAQAQARAIAWQDLALGARLGEGASGEIHRARWRGPTGEQDVAVKLFKGDKTSDGLPASEMAACLAAGQHPHLIGTFGPLQGHPGGRAGLVLPLMPEGCRPLAAPPSLASCTRDVYPEGWQVSLDDALAIATAVASAAAHLHSLDMTHGDLYAHNTLWQAGGPCLLGDFGAAAFTPSAAQPAAPHLARQLQAIEARAFGCLLQELTDHLPPGAAGHRQAALRDLAEHCQHPQAGRRPTLAQAHASLLAL